MTVKIHFPPNSGRADFSQTAGAPCGQAEKCFRQAASLGGTIYPATGFFACPGHPEVAQNFLADTVNGVTANYTRDSAYWDFTVGGTSASVGMSCYFVSDGDVIGLDYNGAYTGPVMSDSPSAPAGAAGLLQGNACINAYRAAWPDGQWPQICGKKTDWAWLEKNGWVRPFTGYSAGKTEGLQAENNSDEKTAASPKGENNYDEKMAEGLQAGSNQTDQTAVPSLAAISPTATPPSPQAATPKKERMPPTAQNPRSFSNPIGTISGPLGIPRNYAARKTYGPADIAQKKAILATAPTEKANPQGEKTKPPTGLATAQGAPASLGMLSLLAVAGALCLKKLLW